MGNPTLVELRRGSVIESTHRGAIAVVDSEGGVVLSVGNVEGPVVPRSAVKALQALPMVEAGASESLRLGNKALALACASHSGEPGHVDVVAQMLAGVGKDDTVLECGIHWPTDQNAALDLARRGARPRQLHNQCSGKHAGFVCLSYLIGVDPSSYTDPRHPVQGAVMDTLASLTGISLEAGAHVIDGCMAPSWPVPLRCMALAFSRFGSGHGLGRVRAEAARKLRAACAAEPWYVGGTARFCTKVMALMGSRAFVKFGAEGVYCASLPECGLGIAIKCDDGAVRAAEVVMAALIRRYLDLDAATDDALESFIEPVVKTWSGREAGRLRPAPELSEHLRGRLRA